MAPKLQYKRKYSEKTIIHIWSSVWALPSIHFLSFLDKGAYRNTLIFVEALVKFRPDFKESMCILILLHNSKVGDTSKWWALWSSIIFNKHFNEYKIPYGEAVWHTPSLSPTINNSDSPNKNLIILLKINRNFQLLEKDRHGDVCNISSSFPSQLLGKSRMPTVLGKSNDSHNIIGIVLWRKPQNKGY